MTEYLGSWMRLPPADVHRLALSCARTARHELRWWWERFSEDTTGLAARFAVLLDELDELEKLCLSATSITAPDAEANADRAGTAATPETTDR